jgi:glycolate oxidase iron-sulfur subunit
MALVEAVMNGRLQISDIFQDRLAACTGCLACESACPSGVPVTEVIQAAKEEAVRRSGSGILARALSAALKNPAALRALARLAPFLLRYADGPFPPEETSVRASVADPPAPVRGTGPDASGRKRGTVAFFPGCAVSYHQPDRCFTPCRCSKKRFHRIYGARCRLQKNKNHASLIMHHELIVRCGFCIYRIFNEGKGTTE